MRMTARQREHVVALLRRAAALESYEEDAHGSFLRSAAIQRSIQLAAAARVASRSWP